VGNCCTLVAQVSNAPTLSCVESLLSWPLCRLHTILFKQDSSDCNVTMQLATPTLGLLLPCTLAAVLMYLPCSMQGESLTLHTSLCLATIHCAACQRLYARAVLSCIVLCIGIRLILSVLYAGSQQDMQGSQETSSRELESEI
jgi:hypothetical protein